MRNLTAAVAVIALALMNGCVLKSDYTASLAVIDSLMKDKAELQDKSAAQEEHIADLNAKIDAWREKQALTRERRYQDHSEMT
jgi:cell division protein FtsB